MPEPSPAPSGAGSVRGRVIDWRGVGLDRFKIHAAGERRQADSDTTADGQYVIANLPPGSYDLTLPGYSAEPARGIPVLAGRVTTVDWQESSERQVVAPAAVATVAPMPPTATATPPPRITIQRPTTAPARPPPPEVWALRVLSNAAELFVTSFLTGMALVAVTAVTVVALIRARR